MRTVIILLALLVVIPLILLLVSVSLYFDHQDRGSGRPEDAADFFPEAVAAVFRYRDMYQRWPLPERSDGTDTRATIAMLRGVDPTHNPLSIDFLEGLDAPIWQTRFDPWGQLYRMQIDTAGRDSVTVGTSTVQSTCVFWSIGPDGVDDFGTGDDLISWVVGSPAAPAATESEAL